MRKNLDGTTLSSRTVPGEVHSTLLLIARYAGVLERYSEQFALTYRASS